MSSKHMSHFICDKKLSNLYLTFFSPAIGAQLEELPESAY
jgi:hypothetical protein